VVDNALYPIIGFHGASCNQKVSINFGIDKFEYGGMEVIVSPICLAARELKRLRLEDMEKTAADKPGDAFIMADEAVVSFESISVESSLEDKISENAFSNKFRALRYAVECDSRTLREQRQLRRQSHTLLRFILAVVCDNDSTLPLWHESLSFDPTKQKRNPLMKGRSSFGTLKSETFGDGALLQQNVYGFLVGQLKQVASNLVAHHQSKFFSFAENESISEKDVESSERDLALSGSTSPRYILDAYEVEAATLELLLSLRSLLAVSKQAKTLLSQEDFVVALLPLLEQGSVRVKSICIPLLQIALPELMPEDLELSLDKVGYMQTFVGGTSQLMESRVSGRQSRRLPDSLVRVLFEGVKASVRPNPTGEAHFFGFGHKVLRGGFLNAALIHRLLETGTYTELVSCFLTDCLRNVADTIANSDIVDESNDQVTEALAAASAAGFIISGLNSLICLGSTVQTPSVSLAVLLSLDEAHDTVSVYPSNTFKSGQETQTLNIRDIHPLTRQFKIDLSTLSQPLLPQIISLFKQLLQTIQKQCEVDIDSRAGSSFWRLSAFISLAIASLISGRQDAVSDAVQFADIISNLVAVAFFDIGLDPFITAADSIDMWVACQSRSLDIGSGNNQTLDVIPNEESFKIEKPMEDTAESASIAMVDPISSIEGETETSHAIDRTVSRSLVFKGPEVEAIILTLSVETESDMVYCADMLTYFMGDVERTRAFLLTSKSEAPVESALDKATSEYFSTLIESQLTPVSFVHSRYVARELGGIPFDVSSSEYTVSSGELLHVVNNDVHSIDTGGSFGQAVDPILKLESDVIVAFFNKEKCVRYTDIVNTSNIELVSKFYGHSHPRDISTFLTKLDRSIVVLHVREVVLRLLLECNINLLTDAPHLEDWIRLIKLCTTSSSGRSGAKSIAELCTALLKAPKCSLLSSADPSAQSLELQLCRLLMEDVLKSLDSLMTPSYSSSLKQSFKSPHPFIEDHTSEGVLDLPTDCKGCKLSFDPRSATPSKLASFKVYISEEDFLTDSCPIQFWGPPGSANAFKTVYFKDTKRVYYRFSAGPGADKPAIKIDSKDVNVIAFDRDEVRGCTLKAPTVRSSTGDDDNLSNFFNSDVATDYSSGVTFVAAECAYFVTGAWYFEVKVTSAIKDVGSALLPDHEALIKIGVVDSTFSFDTDGTDDSALTGSYFMSFSENVSNQFCSSAPTGIKYGDVVGCLFDLKEDTIEMIFSVNGAASVSTKYPLGISGVKPVFTVGHSFNIEYNFGEKRFLNKPPYSEKYKSVLSRPVDFDNKLAFGYELSVEASSSIPYKISRNFTLVCHRKSHENDKEAFYIWRSKSEDGFKNVGDIITLTKQVPLGALVVCDMLCVSPVSYDLVFACSKSRISIWRPVPPDGYVALGDVYWDSTDEGNPPWTSLCSCLPLSAVKKTSLGERIVMHKITTDNKSVRVGIWSLGTYHGLFRGSMTVDASSIDSTSLYTFGVDIGNELTGEWSSEKEIISKPSLSWSCEVLDFLFKDNIISGGGFDDIFSNPSVFSKIIDYVSCGSCPSPLKLIPILIKYVQISAECGKVIDINKLKPLSEAIAQNMGSLSIDAKKTSGQQMFADLIVEYEKYRLVHKQHEANADCPFIYSSDWLNGEISSDEKLLARLIGSSDISTVFAKETMLKRISHVLSFFFSVESSKLRIVNFNPMLLSPELMSKVWFNALSLSSTEQSAHPHSMERFSKTITIQGVDKIMVMIDRRSELAEYCTLKISGGGHVFILKGGDTADGYSKPITFSSSEIDILFEFSEEAQSTNIEHWGWAVYVDGVGLAYESAVVMTKLEELPKDESALTPLLADFADTLKLNAVAPASTEHAATTVYTSSTETVIEPSVTGRFLQFEADPLNVPSDDPRLFEGYVSSSNTFGTDGGEIPSISPSAENIISQETNIAVIAQKAEEILLAKGTEIGRLVDARKMSLPLDTDATIEVKGGASLQEGIANPLVYIITFKYVSGDEPKTTRTLLQSDRDSLFKLNLKKCSEVDYSVHAVLEKTYRALIEELVRPPAPETAPTVPGTPIKEISQPIAWSCGNF
jgi:hypothetical protein